MNSVNEGKMRKDIEEEFACKSEYWLLTENDERNKMIGVLEIVEI